MRDCERCDERSFHPNEVVMIYAVPVDKETKRKLDKRYGRSVRISRTRYSLKWCTAIKHGEDDALGLCDNEHKAIYVVADKSIETTLMHELFHAEAYQSGLTQAPSFTRDFEELCCEIAANAIGTSYELRKR